MIPADDRFDTLVVGGGVYGLLLALEGAARGQRLLLVEREDIGSGASFNHLRTIHGGLRYLQSLDIRRARLSNAQRLWWLRHFPGLVEPIRCLMPLYGRGLRRPGAFRLAFGLGRALGLHRDAEGAAGRFEVISAAAVRELLPACRPQDLEGGAIWVDAFMPSPHRLIAELGHWAESAGATIANHTVLAAAERLRDDGWRVTLQRGDIGDAADIEVSRIVNAGGAACDDVVARIARRRLAPMLVPTLGWNLLLDRAAPAQYSVAVTPPGSRHTWFLHPYHGRTLAGTAHAGLAADRPIPAAVSPAQLRASLEALNEALPGSGFSSGDIRHVFHGVIPGVEAGTETLMKRHRIVDHGRRDALPGLWTVLGVKFTEAPYVARLFWDARLGCRGRPLPSRPPALEVPTVEAMRGMSDEQLRASLQQIAAAEWQADAEDLVWRRTDLWLDDIQARRALGVLRAADPHKV